MEQETLVVKFGGQTHQVDVQTFAYSVLNFATVIKEANKKINGNPIEITIKAPKEGSVLVELAATINTINSLLPQMDHIGELIIVVGAIYGVHKFISGKKVKNTNKNGDNVDIILEDNSKITIAEKVYNIYVNTPAISNGISQHFSALNEDPAVTEFKVSKDNKNIIEVERKDYARLAIKQQFESNNSRTTIESANLYIYKVVFDKTDRKWEFYYNGNRISASISDDSFFNRIDKGESFSKGDQLKVDLQVNQIFDESVGTYVNQSFQILTVNEHSKRSEPIKLPFDKTIED
jgi:hypothetical protein